MLRLIRARSIAAAIVVLTACDAGPTTPPPPGGSDLATEVRQLAAAKGITLLLRPSPVRPDLVRLGRALAFDRELSGNRDIACMTCHLPAFSTGDGRSVSIGQGGTGTGTSRIHPQNIFIGRNAPALFNLHELNSLFWDGRVAVDEAGQVHTPAGDKITPEMAAVFEFGALSAQPMFPVLTRSEMRGDEGNELAALRDDQEQEAWAAIMARLGAIEEYRTMFEAAYRGQHFEDMTFAHASNAIAGFLIDQFASNGSPWDSFLAGHDDALTHLQLAGAKTFLNAKCSACHNGPAFTDNKFHNVTLAQIGPGNGDGVDGHDDFGRMRVTGLAADRYSFRTTPLRNVELTGPWGHAGQFTDLRAFVDHYSESNQKLADFDVLQLEPLLQGTEQPTLSAIILTRDTLLDGVVFTPEQVDEVTAFLMALTDPAARNLGWTIPEQVPSGLPIDGGSAGSRIF